MTAQKILENPFTCSSIQDEIKNLEFTTQGGDMTVS
jgi:hypothetical protein